MKPGPGEQAPFRQRLTVRLTGGVTLVLLLIGCPFLIAFHKLLRDQQLEALAEATTGLSRAVVDGLRSAMLAGKPHLFDETVRRLSEQQQVERVLLLDHEGRVHISSDALYEGRVLNRERDATCRVCHLADGAPARSRTIVTREGGHRVFRAMSTVPNDPACHACHDARAATNGILLMDLTLGAADRRFFAGIGGSVALGGVMVVLTIALLVLLLRRMVHEPLRAMVTVSRRIAQGDLDARVSVSSPGELALLADSVNRMTDHLAQSIKTVKSQHRELQSILDAVDDEIVVLDRGQRVVAANKSFLAGRGEAGADLAGRFCRDLAEHGQMCVEGQGGHCPVEGVFRTGQHQKGIVSHRGADGAERTIEIHASPLRGPGGEVLQAVEVRRDISERRQMEATLAHSEHLASLGLLASGLSHEINNPLGAIATSVEGLRRKLAREPGPLPDATQSLDQVLRRIAQEVERIRQITHRLLKVARPPSGRRSLFDVNQVIRDIVAILAHDMKRSGIEAQFDLTEGLPPLSGDESRLAQVIMNLALNSLQAMEDGGGRLRIATSSENGSIQIEVDDSGVGIPPELLRRIYEPFFTTKPVGKGTGLGLFITHRIVTEMGGTIQVHSQPAKGTLFVVRLPRSQREARP